VILSFILSSFDTGGCNLAFQFQEPAMNDDAARLRLRIDGYRAMIRQIHDQRALVALEYLMAEAAHQLRALEGARANGSAGCDEGAK
jgi:hypothetical protein